MNTKPVFVFISGKGKTLESIIQRCTVATVKYVYSNAADMVGLVAARDAGIMCLVEPNSDQQISTDAIDYMIERSGITPTLIVLAGYMRLLTPEFIAHAMELDISIINIHPSLLPLHKGLHTHKRVLEAGDTTHGFTVHYVTPQLDSGPIVAKSTFVVNVGDTVESLAEAVKIRERVLYPIIIDGLLNEKPTTISR